MFRYLVAVMLLATVYIEAAPASTNCPENEIWDNCGGMCEPTCHNPNPIPIFCPTNLCTDSSASCRCKPGYARDDDGHCIWVTKCTGSLTYF